MDPGSQGQRGRRCTSRSRKAVPETTGTNRCQVCCTPLRISLPLPQKQGTERYNSSSGFRSIPPFPSLPPSGSGGTSPLPPLLVDRALWP